MASFYAVLDRWAGPDVLYKVIVTSGAVHAARVGGGWGRFLGRLAVLGELAPLVPLSLVADPAKEAAYAALDPGSPEWLARDRLNMQLHASQVERVCLSWRRVFGRRRRRAVVEFHRRDGGRRLVLHVLPSDLPAVRDAFAGTAFRVIADGIPS